MGDAASKIEDMIARSGAASPANGIAGAGDSATARERLARIRSLPTASPHKQIRIVLTEVLIHEIAAAASATGGAANATPLIPPLVEIIAAYLTLIPLSVTSLAGFTDGGGAGDPFHIVPRDGFGESARFKQAEYVIRYKPDTKILAAFRKRADALIATVKDEREATVGAETDAECARGEVLIISDYEGDLIRIFDPISSNRHALALPPIDCHVLTPFPPFGDISEYVGTYAGTGVADLRDGKLAHCRMDGPGAMCVVPFDNSILIGEFNSHRLRRITEDGNVQFIAGSRTKVRGYRDGAGDAALFDGPNGLAASNDGTFAIVSDRLNFRVRRVDLTTNEVSTVAGNGADSTSEGPIKGGSIKRPQSVAWDQSPGVEPETAVLIPTLSVGAICRLDFKAGTTARVPLRRLHAPLIAVSRLPGVRHPNVLTSYSAIYLADLTNNSSRVLAGSTSAKGFKDGSAHQSACDFPTGCTFVPASDSSGEDKLYFIDRENRRLRLVSGSILALE